MSEVDNLVVAATGGNRGALARLLSIAERGDKRLVDIESCIAPLVGKAYIVGVTGPPGAGKSSLINTLLPLAHNAFGRAAVLAVDPSSPFSHGAILGDRVRMRGDPFGDSVFIRSMASRGEFGGLARASSTAVRLFDACHWPVIIIETLGIGQVELDIMNLADTVVVVLNPGWGDSIQANKAGLTEAGDIFVINKADKPGVQQTKTDLLDSFSLLTSKIPPAIVETIATSGEGVEDLWQAIEDRHRRLESDGSLASQRDHRRRRMLRQLISNELNHLIDEVLASDDAEALIADTTAGAMDMQITIGKVLGLMVASRARDPL